MSSVEQHYATLLAPVYTWMVGGAEVAFDLGHADVRNLLPAGCLAVDLGAGFGMHAIPLARLGWQVVAIDSSPLLLAELVESARELRISAHCADMLDFADYLPSGVRPDLIICMGDTLTHLPDIDSVVSLARRVGEQLARHGRFIATFRDYTRPPVGNARFIPVRADEQRILTCFLEDAGEHVVVHDLLHERTDGQWKPRVSSYRKLKLQPETVMDAFRAAGMRATLEPAPRGMMRLIADADPGSS